MPRLLAYNTSFVNDAENITVLEMSSESASIIRKAYEIYCKENKISADGEKKVTFRDLEGMFGPKLIILRRIFANQIDTFLLNQLNEGLDFVALIEQSVYVDPDHNAFYNGSLEETQFNIGNDNAQKKIKNDYNTIVSVARENGLETDFDHNKPIENEKSGILKRLKKLGFKPNEDTKKNIHTTNDYTCVFDNGIANFGTTTDYKCGFFGEGIAVIMKNDLYDKGVKLYFKEDKKYNKDDKKKYERLKPNYLSDLGPHICKDSDGKVKFVKNNGKLDNGRPFILCGNYDTANNNNVLNLYVAFHGPNIYNLYVAVGDEKKDGSYDKGDSLKTILSKEDANNKTIIDDLLTNMRNMLQVEIGNALDAACDENKNKITINNDKKLMINLYMGCDANDAAGSLLDALRGSVDKDKNLTILGKLINFNYIGYEKSKLYSCCANQDSLTEDARDWTGVISGTGDINEERFNQVITLNPKGYFKHLKTQASENTQTFINPELFGYNGDYAFYGCVGDTSQQTLSLVTTDETMYQGVQCSDHLPVISEGSDIKPLPVDIANQENTDQANTVQNIMPATSTAIQTNQETQAKQPLTPDKKQQKEQRSKELQKQLRDLQNRLEGANRRLEINSNDAAAKKIIANLKTKIRELGASGGKRRTRRRGRRSTRRKKKLSRRKRHTRKRSRKHKK